MVNTRTDAELAAAVQAAVDAMLPQIREQVREEYRTGAVASGSNPPPVTIHTWLERFNKQKPRSFEKAVAPVDAENWISHMEKIFDVMDCNDAFKTRLAVYKFEGDALAWWKAYKQAKGGDAWVNTLTWAAFKELFFLQFFPRAEQERLKREYHSIRQRANENSTEYMQRFLRLAGFLGQAAGTAEEQAKNYRWGLHKSILDHVMCLPFTDVAQVADAARNLEILRDREDYDRSEQSNKRHKSEDQYQPATQQSSYRSHGQNNDRHGSNRQGGGGNNNNNNNNNNYSSGNNRSSGAGHDQRNRGQQFHRSTSSDSQQSRVPSEGYTHPVCATCGRRHSGECRRASGTCFKCGQAGHLQRDCKKNTGAGTSGHANKKPDASGRVFALTQDQAANTSGTITGTLFIFGRAVFVLFDTGATHSVISTTFASCFTMTPVLLDHVLCISTPLKDSARITHVYGDLPLQFDDKIRSVNALPLDMCEFDMILGIDWLAVHRASVDCHSRRVIFGDIHAPEFIYQGSLPGKSMSCTDSEYFVFVFELSVRIFRPFSKDILSFHDSSPELLCFPIFMSFAMILYMFDFKTYSIARAIYTHDHDLHDLPPSHGEREKSFEELKQRLVSSPILTLPSGLGGFQIYSDASKKGIGCVLHGSMGKRRWLELLKDYDTNIQYHPGKANVVADALSRKSGMIAGIKVEEEIIRDLRSRTASKDDRENGTKLCVPEDPTLREALMTEAHSSPFSIHPGSTKMYHDLKQHFWWSGMKRDVATFVFKSSVYISAALRLNTNCASSDRVTIGIHVSRFSVAGKVTGKLGAPRLSSLVQLENWDDSYSLVEFAFNNSWHASIKCAPFVRSPSARKALRKLRPSEELRRRHRRALEFALSRSCFHPSYPSLSDTGAGHNVRIFPSFHSWAFLVIMSILSMISHDIFTSYYLAYMFISILHDAILQYAKTLELFGEIMDCGFERNYVSYTAGISAYAKVMDVERGKEVHDEAVTNGFGSDRFVQVALLDM
ncbi:putative reverse transcriptase domain-containing protein [Tanacetum coccineum]